MSRDDCEGRHRKAPGHDAAPVADDDAFYISAVRPASRVRRALKSDDTFAVIDAHGDINARAPGVDGLFHCDMRHLSYAELSINGAAPLLLGSGLSQDTIYLRADLTNPDVFEDGHIALFKDQVHIERTTYLRPAQLLQSTRFTNYGPCSVSLVVVIGFDADFCDLFEVRGARRTVRGKLTRTVVDAGVVFAYAGLDGVRRETSITFAPVPKVLKPTLASYRIELPPRGETSIELRASCCCELQDRVSRPFLTGLISARRDVRKRMARQAAIVTGSAALNEVLRRSSADLAMLMTETRAGPYPYAGVPWFSAPFGRDGLITALEMLWIDPELARGVLGYLAHYQAMARDAASDAEPGKILHEARFGEMAALKDVPFGSYYGSVDATPLFVVLACAYAEVTGDSAYLADLWPSVEAALAWIAGHGDADGDGFIEYQRAAETGLLNQGWKDSTESVFHADGRLATGPVALIEVQAYAYEARRRAAAALRRNGDPARADALDTVAERQRARINEVFWCDDIGCYALALDGEKMPCRVLSSNAGHVLRSGLADAERAQRLARLLLEPAFFSGWGIRTIADSEVRYNPMSYHNGSIWPHDNAIIAAGLRRVGAVGSVDVVLAALIEAASALDQRRLPELFCGFRRRRGRGPILYPVACSPQAWASGAVFHVLEAMLGVEVNGCERRLRFVEPRVPEWLGFVDLKRLRVGSSLVDVRLVRRLGGAVALEVMRNDDDVVIEI